MRGGWSEPISHCLMVEEATPPKGYLPSPAPLLVCRGPGGWTTANAAGVELTLNGRTYTAGAGAWTITNVEETLSTTLTLVNVPWPTLTIAKVDAAGALLPGATFEGWSYSKFDGEPTFTCIPLTDDPWFAPGLTQTGTTGTSFADEIYIEGDGGPWVNQCLVVRETAPLAGYLPAGDPAVVCLGPGGWTTANAEGQRIELAGGTRFTAGAGQWTISNTEATRTPCWPCAPCPSRPPRPPRRPPRRPRPRRA